MLCALVIVKIPIRGAPTFPPIVISPLPAVRVRSKTPATVFDRFRLPPPELRRALFVRVTGETIERAPAVVILEPKETLPAPD